MKHLIYMLVFVFIMAATVFAQSKDKGNIVEKKNEFWDKIEESCDDFAEKKEPAKKVFKMDFSEKDLPTSVDQFKKVWYNKPVSQGWTGTCWSFSTTSFFESEVKRIHGKELELSPIYTAYWEYVEKARRFIKERGDSYFAEGSEANAVMKIWKIYGVVPLEDYYGLLPEQEFHDHHVMVEEIEKYLNSLKKTNAWNEKVTLETVKSILNHYLGTPPEYIKVNGKKMTPMEYFKKVVKLNPDDYIELLSLKGQTYYEFVEYKVPDNWWHSEDYLNVPLNDFMSIMKSAMRDGYSICLGGDVSEAGYDAYKEVALVPDFDIPSEYINEDARQFRFSNETTTDDHGIHCVGWMEKEGKDWYLIKDSGSGSKNGNNWGFYFYHEDYVKLKMMNILVHKEAAKDILKKIKK